MRGRVYNVKGRVYLVCQIPSGGNTPWLQCQFEVPVAVAVTLPTDRTQCFTGYREIRVPGVTRRRARHAHIMHAHGNCAGAHVFRTVLQHTFITPKSEGLPGESVVIETSLQFFVLQVCFSPPAAPPRTRPLPGTGCSPLPQLQPRQSRHLELQGAAAGPVDAPGPRVACARAAAYVPTRVQVVARSLGYT